MYMAGDSTTNLHVALDMYKEQLSEIQGMKLRYTMIACHAQSYNSITISIMVAEATLFLSSYQETTSSSAKCMDSQELVVSTTPFQHKLIMILT